jgi:hypothetical protein
MVNYICPDCGKDFGNSKCQLNKHSNRKFPCKKIEIISPPKTPEIAPTVPEFAPEFAPEILKKEQKITATEINNKKDKLKEICCQFCNSIFTRNTSLDRHLQSRCKVKKELENKKQNIGEEQLNLELVNKKIEEIVDDKINIIIQEQKQLKIENEKLKKSNLKLKKDNVELKQIVKKNKSKSDINIKIINNNQKILTNNNQKILTNNNNNQKILNNNNNNQKNIVNFNNMDYANIDKKLFASPLLNTKLFGKEIILKMVENIYINENLPEYQNIIITDKNRGYVKVFNNGKWKTDNIQIINLVIDGIISHSKTIWEELNDFYINNIQAKNRLKTSKKYINLCDLEYLDELENEFGGNNDDFNDTDSDTDYDVGLNENKKEIKRCKEFREMVFKDTINLFHDNKNILLKPKKLELIDL